MNELRVPQREIKVHVRLTDGRNFAGVVYLPDIGPDGAPYTLDDRLADTRSGGFLPMTSGERTHVVSIRHILTLRVDDRRGNDEDLEETYGKQLHVRFYLSSGDNVDGDISILRKDGKERLQDYLVDAPPFLSVRLALGKRLLIARDHVTSALALEEPAS